KKNASFKKPFHYNLSGITMKAKGAKLNVYEITQVRTQSVADKAGIIPGDIVLSVNGIVTANLDLNIINAFLNKRPGKKIKMDIERDGKKFKKKFILTDQI